MALTAEQTKTLEHVGYEWWMFRATHDCLKGWPAPTPPGEEDPIRNAVLESLVPRWEPDRLLSPPPRSKKG
jgi:hypothetical protein